MKVPPTDPSPNITCLLAIPIANICEPFTYVNSTTVHKKLVAVLTNGRYPLAALALLAALSGCASEPWGTSDRVLAFTALGATIADWGQARYIAEHPTRFADRNPILGEHPSRGKVDAYFICAIGGGYFLADALPSRYRKLFLGGATIIEISAVHDNRSIGVGFRW